MGSPGVGQTTLSRVFADRAKERFPGGTTAVAASSIENADHLLSRLYLDHSSKPALLIVDDAELLGVDGLRLLDETISRHPQLRLIITARPHSQQFPDGFQILELAPFTIEEMHELMHLRGLIEMDGPPDAVTVERIFKATHGNPAIATVAAEAVRSGLVETWNDLFQYFRDFQTTGLVGPDGQPLGRDTQEFRKIIIDVSATNEQIMEMLQNNPKMLWQLPPRKFEEIIADILDKQGYSVTLTPASGDGGFDMFAAKRDGLGQFLYLVECKRYVPPNKVGVEIVRSLYGVLQAKKATAGAIVTSSFFTKGAEEFQGEQQHQLQLHDYFVLQQWIRAFPTRPMKDAE